MFFGLENIGLLYKGIKAYVDRQISRAVKKYVPTETMVTELFIEEGMMVPMTDEYGNVYADYDETEGYTIYII